MSQPSFPSLLLAAFFLIISAGQARANAGRPTAEEHPKLYACVAAWDASPQKCKNDNLPRVMASNATSAECRDLINRYRALIKFTSEPDPGQQWPRTRCSVGTPVPAAKTEKTLDQCVSELTACADVGVEQLEAGCQVKIREALKSASGSALVRNSGASPFCRLGAREAMQRDCLKELWTADNQCRTDSINSPALAACKTDLAARLSGGKKLNPEGQSCVVVDAADAKCPAHPIPENLLVSANASLRVTISQLGEARGEKCAQLSSIKGSLERQASLRQQCADLKRGVKPTGTPADLAMQCVRLDEQGLRERAQALGLDQASCDALLRPQRRGQPAPPREKAEVCRELAKRKTAAKPLEALEQWESECARLTKEAPLNKDTKAACATRDRIKADTARLHAGTVTGARLDDILSRYQTNRGAAALPDYERDLLGSHLSSPYQRKVLETQCRDAASLRCKQFVDSALLEARAAARLNGHFGSDPKRQENKRLMTDYLSRLPGPERARFNANFDKCGAGDSIDRRCQDAVVADFRRKLSTPSKQTVQLCSNVPPSQSELYAACRPHLQDVLRQTPGREPIARPVPPLGDEASKPARTADAQYQAKLKRYQDVCKDFFSIVFNPPTCWGGPPKP